MKKGQDKRIIIVFLLVFLIILSTVIVLSQQTAGTTQSGNQEKPLSEDKTKAGENPPQQQGTIQDTNGAEKGGESQDIGGLVGLESQKSDSKTPEEMFGDEVAEKLGGGETNSELKGQNLNFKRETESDGEKVTLTQNKDLGRESKVELNENEFSNKEPEENLGEKSRFVIEKKDNEKYAEAGVGTEYQVNGGEDGKNNAVDELAGREIELSPDTKVEIKDQGEGKKLVDMTVPEGGEIHTPGERKNGKEKKDKETDYRWNGLNLNWLDNQGNSNTVNGELFWNQNNGFYVPSAKNTNIDGIDIYSTSTKGNFDTQIFGDGRVHPEATGAYASFGEDNLITASNGKTPGPLLEFQSNNKYGVNFDSKTDVFRMQADSGGEISLTRNNLNTQDNSVDIYGNGIVIDGDRRYVSDGYRTDIIKETNLAGATPVSTEIIPRGINGGDSLLGNNKRWQINGENNDLNQALINSGPNPISNNQFQYKGTNADSKIGQNFINSPGEIIKSSSENLGYNIRMIGKSHASSNNFITITNDDYSGLRENILKTAENARNQVAREWLGEELPLKGKGKVVVSVINMQRDDGYYKGSEKYFEGATSMHSSKNQGSTLGSVFLDVDREEFKKDPKSYEKDLYETISHEVTHTVLGNKFNPYDNKGLNAWVEEGIATGYNTGYRSDLREGFLMGWANGKVPWPTDYQSFIKEETDFSDQYHVAKSYAISTSTVNYLLSENPNKQNFIKAADYARDNGWDASLKKYYGEYGIQNTGQLEREWKEYVQQNYLGKQIQNVETRNDFDSMIQKIREDEYYFGSTGFKNHPYDLASPDWREYVKQRYLYESSRDTNLQVQREDGRGYDIYRNGKIIRSVDNNLNPLN